MCTSKLCPKYVADVLRKHIYPHFAPLNNQVSVDVSAEKDILLTKPYRYRYRPYYLTEEDNHIKSSPLAVWH